MRQSKTASTEQKLALRINDAVAVCGLSRATLYRLMGEQRLPTTKVGGRRLILRDDLIALLNGGRDGWGA